MYINKVIIYGNVTRDPELKALPSGSKVANFSVATNRTLKDQAGKKQEAVEYHNVVFFGKQAEVIAQYIHKGSGLYIEGRLSTRSWDGQDGKKNYRTEVIGDTFQFGPKGGASTGGSVAGTTPADNSSLPEIDAIEYPTDDINPNDIPF
jgi:single-strand DNA-binding protein